MWVKRCHKPPMTGNGDHTTYKNCDLGDGLWHCFAHIIARNFRNSAFRPVFEKSGINHPCYRPQLCQMLHTTLTLTSMRPSSLGVPGWKSASRDGNANSSQLLTLYIYIYIYTVCVGVCVCVHQIISYNHDITVVYHYIVSVHQLI